MPTFLERAFVEPFLRLSEQFAVLIPALVTLTVILIIGGAVAWASRQLLYRLLVAIHFDRLAGQMGIASTIERTRVFTSPSDFGARVAQGFVWLVVALFALTAVNSEMTNNLVIRFVSFVPDLMTAGLVLFVGSVISRFLGRSVLLAAVNAQWAGARLLAGGVRVLVMLLAVVVALEQLQIGRTALLVSFAILFGGVVIAAAIAFGLGARDLAHDWLQSKVKPQEPEEEEVFRHL